MDAIKKWTRVTGFYYSILTGFIFNRVVIRTEMTPAQCLDPKRPRI